MNPEEPEEPQGGGRAWMVWSLGALFFCYAFFQRVAPSVMVGDLMRDFNVGAAVLGNLSAFYFYAYAGIQIPVGVMMDRYGPRRLLTGTAILCGLGSLLFAAADSLGTAYAGRLLVGFGAGFAFVGTFKLAATWFPVRRFAFLGGLTMMAGMTGGVGGQAPLAAAVSAFGWRGTLAAAGVFAFALAFVIWLVVRDSPQSPSMAHSRPGTAAHGFLHGLKQTLTTPQTWIISLYSIAMTAPVLSFAALWGVPYMMQAHGLERPAAAASMSLMLIGWGIGAPLSGWLSDRIRRRVAPMAVGAACAVGGLAAAVYLPGLPLAAVEALLVVSGVASGAAVIAYAAAREHNPPTAAGATIGFVNMVAVGSGAVFQPLIGWLLDLNWDGSMAGGARVYSLETFETALLSLIGAGIVAVAAALMVRETRCRQVRTET